MVFLPTKENNHNLIYDIPYKKNLELKIVSDGKDGFNFEAALHHAYLKPCENMEKLQQSSTTPKMAYSHSPMNISSSPSTSLQENLMDYLPKLLKCKTLENFKDFIIEIRGPYPEDNPAKQMELKKKIIGEWFKCNNKVFTKCSRKSIKEQAYKLLEIKDLHYVEFSHDGQFLFERRSSSFKIKGEKYRCEKCNNIFYKHFTAATRNATYDLDLCGEDPAEFYSSEEDVEDSDEKPKRPKYN